MYRKVWQNTKSSPPHNFMMFNSNERKQNIKISEQTFKMTSLAGQISQLTEEKPVKLLVGGQEERKSTTEIGTTLPQQKLTNGHVVSFSTVIVLKEKTNSGNHLLESSQLQHSFTVA